MSPTQVQRDVYYVTCPYQRKQTELSNQIHPQPKISKEANGAPKSDSSSAKNTRLNLNLKT